MKTFLRDIAEEILQRHRDHLDKIILIVPGKRAGLFLKRQLAACLGRPMVSPRVMLMPQWMEWLSGETMSNRISQNLLLYEAYLEVMGDKADPFEQFSGWSSTILSDLSDIDQELVDEESLFRDLRDVREIENWSFHQLPLSDSQVRYLAFWSELGKISAAFRKLQKKEKLIGYSGLARSLAENSPSLPEGVSHFWFVGLSSFSEAEQRIVNTFVVQNNATVRWDADVYYVKNPLHEAGRFFRQRMKKEAIGLYDLLSSNSCEFNVFECTTAIGQILSVAQHLKTLPPEEMSESVVVVIDETLLFPLIRRIPDTISDVNVALGMSLRHTSAFKFVMAAFRLHINGCRKTGEHFFFEDFAEVISEPVIVSLMGNYSIQLKNHLISNHTNLIGKSDWEGAVNLFPEWISLGFLLEKPIASSTQFIAAVKRVCLLMNEKISEDVQGTEGLAKMITVLDEFEKMIVGREYLRDISAAHAFFSQVVTNEKISFEGEAFSGLQVLGMVETRAIDFKNVFIVGANEDIFPGNLHSASLIPADIKRIYHLPDASQKESMYAHTFYRLLQRAEKVNLYYSSITSDFKGTEQSRFITQIELELSKMNPRISFRKHRVHIPDREKSNMHPGIENNEWSKNRLDKLFASGISPSAINCYNKCPMDFFYRYIIGIGEKEEMENHIDVSTFGSVVHHVLEKFFGKYIGNFPEEKELEDFKNHLQSYMDEAWEEHYSSARMDKGYNFLAATVAKEMLYKTINNEIEAQRSLKEQGKNIKIIAIEQPLKREVEGRKYGWDKPVSLRGKADRIDEVAGIIRILDYKTGKTEKKDVTWKNDDIFTYEKSKLLQLIAYVYMYCNEGQKPENVIAAIYSLKNFSEGLMILDPGSEPITEEKLFVFEEGLINWIKKVYDSPFFAHNPVSTYCEYCHRE